MALTALVRIAPHCVRAINQPDHSALNKPASQHLIYTVQRYLQRHTRETHGAPPRA